MAVTGAAEEIDTEGATGTWSGEEAAMKAAEVDDEEATGTWSREVDDEATGTWSREVDDEEATGTWSREIDDEEATGAWSREEQGSKSRAEGLLPNSESPPDPDMQDRVERGSEGGDGEKQE